MHPWGKKRWSCLNILTLLDACCSKCFIRKWGIVNTSTSSIVAAMIFDNLKSFSENYIPPVFWLWRDDNRLMTMSPVMVLKQKIKTCMYKCIYVYILLVHSKAIPELWSSGSKLKYPEKKIRRCGWETKSRTRIMLGRKMVAIWRERFVFSPR